MNRKYISIIVLSLLIAISCGRSDSNLGAVDIIKNLGVTKSLEVPTPYENSAHVVLAKGEFESFQLALGVDSVSQLNVRREAGSPLLNLKCYELVAFDGVEGALVPRGESITPQGDVLKLWFTYEADRAIEAGVYHEKLLFTAKNKTKTIEVTVEVKDITIPVTPSIPVTFGVYQKTLVNSEDENVQIAKRKEYFEMLFDCRISPYLVNWGPPNKRLEVQSSPYTWEDPRTAEYIRDPRFAAIALPYWGKTDEELQEIYSQVEAAQLLDKSYVYFIDEPRSAEDHQKAMEGVQRIYGINPKVKVNLPFFCGLTQGSDDIIAVFERYKDYPMIFNTSNWALQDNEARSAACANAIVGEQEWWTYICCGQKPGFTHNTDPIGIRSMLWRSWKEGSTGFLYWAVNDYISIDPFKMNQDLKPGDGSLIYPGVVFGVDKPVPTIRLERFRDGAEDYELLVMYEKKHGRSATLELLKKVYQAPKKQTDNVQDVENFRLELMDGLLP